MTRVLMIAPTPFFADRGCHVRIFEQARSLAGQGLRPLIVTYPIGNDPPGLNLERAPDLISYRRLEPGPAWTRLILDAQVLARAWSICRRERPDVIHAYLHEGCLIGATLSILFRIPLLFDYQGSLTEESIQHGFIQEGSIMARLFRAVETAAERAADRITVSSAAMAAPLAARDLPVETLGDVVDPDRFAPGPADPSLAARLGLPPGRPVAVYLGAMSDYQGADLILTAARLLKDRGETPVHFLLMGYPETAYRRMARALAIEDRVTFTGRVDYFQAPAFLRLGTIALAPKLARTEANGKVLNYMACGLPVVVFDLPVNRELLGENAFWVPPSPNRDDCAERLARAITAAVSDHESADRLARAGRERAVREFSPAAAGLRLEQIYRELADRAMARERPGPRKLLKLACHQAERARAAAGDMTLRILRRRRAPGGAEREAEHWSRRAPGAGLAWQDHPRVREAINLRVSGDPNTNWLAWFGREFGAGGFSRALNLGCGFGDLEAHAFGLGLVRSFHSIDLSAAAIAEARQRLAGQPVTFEQADANDFIPAPGQFDVVFAASALHHFLRLEAVLGRVRDALRPGGLLVFDEFVGPSRFQWTEDQLDLINALLAALPGRYRRDRRRGFGLKRRVYLPPAGDLSRDSPFEAARSAEIVPLVAERFAIVARRDYGGTILHPLLDRIAGNFRLDSDADTKLLRRLIALEGELIASGRLTSDFAVVVARKREGE